MQTVHSFQCADSRDMSFLENESVHLVVTSPPYPMISMWDEQFSKIIPGLENDLLENPVTAFEKMHTVLDSVWRETARVIRPGGIVAINIGDAVRTIHGDFALYPNHSRIIESMLRNGFSALPPILWRKQTNAPNKFMGSGMLPGGAYVTYEHEYILIFRKGSKRIFSEEEKKIRAESAYFWEERNIWFSDLWEFKGIRQIMDSDVRFRSAAFPLELPFRLIQMYSMYGDTVLDPFVGLGTTSLAAMISGRNSLGVDLEAGIFSLSKMDIEKISTEIVSRRFQNHVSFVQKEIQNGREFRHINETYDFEVMTSQEKKIQFYQAREIQKISEEKWIIHHNAYFPEAGKKVS